MHNLIWYYHHVPNARVFALGIHRFMLMWTEDWGNCKVQVEQILSICVNIPNTFDLAFSDPDKVLRKEFGKILNKFKSDNHIMHSSQRYYIELNKVMI